MVLSSLVAWSDHKALLLSGLRSLFSTGLNSDLEIKCHERVFRVHKLVVGLFTDFFSSCDGLWIRIDVNPDHLESVLKFIYHGQVVVDYSAMEGFLQTCKLLGVRLFKGAEVNAEGMGEDQHYQERYELNDFRLLCRNCYKCFPDEKSLKRHTWGCQRVRGFSCDHCDKTFRHKFDKENHERTHTGERLFACPRPDCNKTFKIKSGMQLHVKTFHDNVRYSCSQCEAKLKSSTALQYHVRTAHSKNRPYSCMECGNCFPSNSRLALHRRMVHLKIKPKKKAVKKPAEGDPREQEVAAAVD